jgi:tetratricopeptide (TPR) repeat protein
MSPSSALPSEQHLIQRALQLARQGKPEQADSTLRDVLRRNPDSLDARALFGALAFQQHRYEEAVAAYGICAVARPRNCNFQLNLGIAREKAGDLPGAIDAFLAARRLKPRDWRIALFAGAALEAAGRREEAAVVFSLGDELDSAMRAARNDPALDPELRTRSAIADRVMREHFSRLHVSAVDEFQRRALVASGVQPDLARVRNAIWTQTHDRPFSFRTRKQQPSVFYMPDLEPRPVTPRERLPWAATIEAATSEIRSEYLAALAADVPMAPYVDASVKSPTWQGLRGNLEWSALHLYKSAQETPLVSHFPKTLQALEAADVVRVDGGKPIEMFFSRMRPGAHIPPHFGCANNRLTVHLPLIVPEGCSIRIGDEIHTWREGELFAFDDSFEHEAWNRSDKDRVVLIFESHHPDLSMAERAAVEHAFESRGRWLKERRLTLP